MGYGEQFIQYQLPEWSVHYLDYAGLRDALNFPIRGETFCASTSKPVLSHQMSEVSIPLISHESRHDSWLVQFSSELEKVSSFFRIRRAELESEVTSVISHRWTQPSSLIVSHSSDPRRRLPSLWRAVQQTHRDIWCLEVFSEVNYLACLQLVDYIRSTGKSDLADKTQAMISGSEFSGAKELNAYRSRLYLLIADHLTHDVAKAKQLLARSEMYTDPSDIFQTAFYLGMSLIMLVWSLVLILGLDHMSVLSSSMPVFRLTLCFVALLWVSGAVIYVFEAYSINWLFIFEIKTQVQISYQKLWTMASTLTVVWAGLMVLHSFYLRFGLEDEHRDFISVGTCTVFFLLMLLPGYPEIRKGLFWTFANIVISPFGKVEFRHFFIADVVTSVTKQMTDILRASCYLTSDAWILSVAPECPHQTFWLCVITLLPLYFRAMQCLKKYYLTKNAFPHLYNFGKYAVGMTVVLLLYIPVSSDQSTNLTIWILASIIASAINVGWDTLIDFGLIDFKNGWKIRGNRTFPGWMHVIGVGLNTILRFVWVVTLFPLNLLGHDLLEVELVLVVLCLLELFRRGLWTLLRVENEKFSNLEKFRRVDFVPKVSKMVLD